jgi:hypothetical protein
VRNFGIATFSLLLLFLLLLVLLLLVVWLVGWFEDVAHAPSVFSVRYKKYDDYYFINMTVKHNNLLNPIMGSLYVNF